MHPHIVQRRPIAAARGGFTLIEMLVATTLVVLMMLMFAQIYLAAISSLGRQQASARNDGKARLADLLLRGDLQRASYRTEARSNQGLVPLVKGDVPSQMQKGFFYLSENDQASPTDDVLHFTTYITRGLRNRDPSYYYGRCEEVPNVLKYEPSPTNNWEYSNHPEIDDGDTTNAVGCSRAAEVVYFVRGSNLYRRVLLVRDLELSGRPALNSAQPSRTNAVFNGRIDPGPSYYKAFDYSAYCQVDQNNLSDPNYDHVQFLGIDALSNLDDASESLGRSFTRFGFAQPAVNQDQTISSYVRARGVPVEYDTNSPPNFFGRPVHGETCSDQWQWPGTRNNALLQLLSYDIERNQLSESGTAIVDPSTASRESEDLLLSNVESFDVEVWDPGLYEDVNQNGSLNTGEDLNGNGFLDLAEGFVQLGNSGSTGYFRSAGRLNPHYGPGADPTVADPLQGLSATRQARNWVFDTGHPDMWTEDPYQENTTTPAFANWYKPPYRPLKYRLTEDVNNNGSLDSGEDLNANGILDVPVFPTHVAAYWTASQPYVLGDVVFKPAGVTPDGVQTSLADSTFSIAYRCVVAGTSGTLPPSDWEAIPGERTIESSPSTVVWEAFDNRVGLKKIRISVRIRDPIEGTPRQFSIVHSFVNTDN